MRAYLFHSLLTGSYLRRSPCRAATWWTTTSLHVPKAGASLKQCGARAPGAAVLRALAPGETRQRPTTGCAKARARSSRSSSSRARSGTPTSSTRSRATRRTRARTLRASPARKRRTRTVCLCSGSSASMAHSCCFSGSRHSSGQMARSTSRFGRGATAPTVTSGSRRRPHRR